MSSWATSSTRSDLFDVEVLEESALAMAQSTIHYAMSASGMSKADLARKLNRNRSFVSHMLSGSHNLTIKTMARSMAACGFEVRFQPVQLEWRWVNIPEPQEVEPANAGTTMLAA